MTKTKYFILAFTLFLFSRTQAQGTTGKDFWIAYMAQDWGCYYNNSWNGNDTPMVFLSSQFHATVTIKAKGQSFSKTVTLLPNITTAVTLPNTVVCRYSDSVTTNGVNVYSDSAINVYAVNRFWYSKGATVVIPSESIIKSPEYVVTTAKETYNWGWSCNGKIIKSPEFTIVGIADSSVIEIVPTGASSRNSAANTPFQITLKKGETFQYITTDDDLTGTIIRTKYLESKYAVFAGNRQVYSFRVNQNNTTCWSSWDHTFEQMTPTITWGRDYTALPFKNNLKGYTLKIVSAEQNTRVSINGIYKATIGQGKYYIHEVYSDTLVRINANNRISVAQFTLGGGYNNSGCQNHPIKSYMGDPAQLQLFPDEQMGNNATINTVSQTQNYWWSWWWWNQYKPEHYINVMTKTKDTANFQLNYKKINNNAWKTAPNFSGYHYAQIGIDSGSHYLKSNKGFLSYVYGYDAYEGYAYAAAANFKPIQNNFIITNAQCVRDTTVFQAVVNDTFTNYKFNFGDNTATTNGAKLKHKYKDTGWFTVRMICTHVRTGVIDTVTKSLYIADTKIKNLFNKDTAICGPLNIIVISKNFNMDNEYKWNDGWPVYYRAIKTAGIYWLEVKERNGCVYRDSLAIANYRFPEASFNISDSQFCFNKNRAISFKNNSSSIDSISNLTWDYGDGKTSITRDSIHSYKFSKAGQNPVKLTLITKYGCRHDTFKTVDILASPKADFGFTKKDTCYNNNGISLKNNTIKDTAVHKRFKWYFSEGFVISNNNPTSTRTYPSTGKYYVDLIYENKNGCVDTLRKRLEIYSHPAASFTYPNSAVCARDSILFKTASTANNKPLTNTWKWGDNSQTITLDSSSKHAYNTFGNYSVKLITYNPQGCKDSISKTVNLLSTPMAAFNINKDTQCINGNSFNFKNITKTNAKNNYTWLLGDGTVKTDSNIINKTYIKDSTYTVMLKAVSSQGCRDSISKNIYVGGYPNANFLINKDKQCFRNNAFAFTNSSNIAKGSIKFYAWNFGNNTVSALKDLLSIKYVSEDTFNVRLIAESNLGCRDTNTKKVIVFAQPKADFNLPNATQCFKGNAFTFNNNSSIKYGKLNYNWRIGNGVSKTDSNLVHNYTRDSIYNVRLIVSSNNNCVDTIFKIATVNASPKAIFMVPISQQCFRNNLFNFNNNSTIASGSISTNNWTLGDGFTRITKDIVNYNYNSEDTFQVELITTSNNGCKDTTQQAIITFAQPKVLFNLNSTTQCFSQQLFEFKNASLLKYGTLNYTWQMGDNTTENSIDVNKKYTTEGSYTVKLIAQSDHNCKDTISQNITLNESPKSKYNIDKGKQCFRGNVFNFTNQSTTKSQPIITYKWMFSDGYFNNIPNILNYKFNTEDTFTSSLVVTNAKNCTDTATQYPITFAQPKVNFKVPNDSQCWQKNFFVINNNTTLKYGSLVNAWQFGDSTTSNVFAPNTKQYANASASYIIRYKAVSDHGCSDSAQKRVVLLERPISAFDINDSVQCFRGHNFSFVNRTKFSALYSLRYWWQYDNGDTSVGILPKMAQYINPGIYKVRLVSYSYLTNCFDTLLQNVISAPHANVDFGINKDTQCLRFNDFVFTNNSTVQFGSNTYEWQYGNGNKNYITNGQQSYITENTYTVKLKATTNYGCKDSITQPVNFYATPKAVFTINDSTQCFNNHSFNFENKSTISNGTFTQNWWFDDNSVLNTFDVLAKKIATPLWHKMYVSVLSNNGCKDTLPQTVYLENDKNISIQLLENDSQCLKGNTFTMQINNSNSKMNIQSADWRFGDNGFSGDIIPSTYRFIVHGNFNVKVKTVSTVGCIDSANLPIVVHPHPTNNFTVNEACFPEPLNFSNLSSIAKGNIINFKWNFGDNSSNRIVSPKHYYKSAGTYSVSLFSSSEYVCTDSIYLSNIAIVKAKPLADFNFNRLPTINQDETRLQFKSQSSNDAVQFYWDFGNNTYNTLKNPIGLYQDTGKFNVTHIVWNNANCSDTIVKNTGRLLPDFFMYMPTAFSPNRNGINELFKPLGSQYVHYYSFEIYNRWGEMVFKTDNINDGWDGKYQNQECMEGVYLCKIYVIPFNGAKRALNETVTLLR